MPAYAPVAVGRLYPERADDLAWENDLVGFRAFHRDLDLPGINGTSAHKRRQCHKEVSFFNTC